jgi:DNA-binding MarR family transcriptional regulator
MRILEHILQAEADVIEKVAGLPIDLTAMTVASNIWRASQLFRQQMERGILKDYQLTWASFSTLYIVWVWGPIEMGEIAISQSVGPSTVTSTVSLLEKRGYCERYHRNGNRRSVVVSLTATGKALIEQIFPRFNQQEKAFISALDEDEAQILTELLRKIIKQQADSPLLGLEKPSMDDGLGVEDLVDRI